MKKELAQKYNHKDVEADKYAYWLEQNTFYADPESDKETFTIVLPPPNVTGKLHVGHAWDGSIQDILIRLKRMQGYNALYLPGMDHAGIATQAKVEERLRGEGISRYDLGREKFIERVWDWKEEYAENIRAQWHKLGLSLDYSKERFTLDAGASDAVKKVFVEMYERGHIYRGKRIINWDPVQKTALSNIEVIYKDIEGAEHYFKYMFADDSGEYLTIMTTRPETMFGDGAIAVNPADERYKDVIGKHVKVPITGYEIPIIADDYVTYDKGSGAVKITPAHDPNDYEVGLRHNIPQEIIMNPDGTMATTDRVPEKYQGMDRFVARKAFVEDAQAAGLVVKIEPFTHSVGHSERSGAIVEPYLSDQWFVKMSDLAEESLAFQKTDDKINFYPERFENVFSRWMGDVHDWCISRQLWWGHRIPAWYHRETGEVYVGENDPVDIENWEQDEDVLDTWFSSALWPFSTLNWPNEHNVLFQKFFPTSVLVTGYDIIFFWVSRMIFQSLQFTKQKPFDDVLIHGLVRAADGSKMSKSLGNGIDPMDVIEEHGADSLRYFLVTNTSPGQDIRYNEEKVISASNFANKVWNASRFVLMDNETKDISLDFSLLDQVDFWILEKLNYAVAGINKNTDKYEFGEAGRIMYHFIRDEFCDWYIELSKPVLYGEHADKKAAKQKTLLFVLDAIVKMLHPYMPFITEEIWQALPHTTGSVSLARYPEMMDIPETNAIAEIDLLQQAIVAVRQIRAEYNVAPSKALEIYVKAENNDAFMMLGNQSAYLERFMNADPLHITSDVVNVDKVDQKVFSQFVIYIPLEDLVDFAEQKVKLENEIKRLEGEIKRATGMLSNKKFVEKAPEAKVAEEKAKLADYEKQLHLTQKELEKLD